MQRTSSAAFCTASTPATDPSEKYEFFKGFFETTPTLTPAQKKLAHSLRYEVFCHIPGFEDPKKFTDGMETDKYDRHAEHALLYYRPLNKPLLPLGTIRVVFPNQDDLLHSFPLQDVMPDLFKKDENKIKQYCEFSRLCLSRAACKEALGDMSVRLSQIYSTSLPMAAAKKKAQQTADQFLNLASIALIGGAYELILSRRIRNCINAMEPHHMQKLIDLGMIYDRLGPDIEYHGTRTPFESNINKVLKNTAENHPFIRKILSAEGRNDRFNDQLFPQERSSSTRPLSIVGYVTPLKPRL